MMPEPMVLKRLKPYYGRISVIESPVDEEQRESGLIVPIERGLDDVARGVITAIDLVEENHQEESYIKARLEVGTVVYFQGGIRISDLIFITSSDIIAYEEA